MINRFNDQMQGLVLVNKAAKDTWDGWSFYLASEKLLGYWMLYRKFHRELKPEKKIWREEKFTYDPLN